MHTGNSIQEFEVSKNLTVMPNTYLQEMVRNLHSEATFKPFKGLLEFSLGSSYVENRVWLEMSASVHKHWN